MNWYHRIALFVGIALAAPVLAQNPQLSHRLELLAAKDNAEAVYHLGMLHHLGLGGYSKDPKKAFSHFQRAAAAGDPLGAFKVGCYYAGQESAVVAPDQARALAEKLVAAKAGYSLAQYDVGFHYARDGQLAASLPWFQAAAAQGEPGGLYGVATISAQPGKLSNPVWAYSYFKLLKLVSEGVVDQRAQQTLNAMAAKLTPKQRQEGDLIVANYRPVRTALTIKALSGSRAAEQLVARSN
jgi:uncharacterized protein